MGILAILGGVLAVAYLGFGIWGAKKRDSILEQCKGCLTGWNTFWYADFLILLVVLPIFLVIVILELLGVHIIRQVGASSSLGWEYPVMFLGVWLFAFWRVAALHKKMLCFGGKEHLGLLKRMAFLAGIGGFFRIAFFFIHVSATAIALPAFNRTIRTEDGEVIPVAKIGDDTYIDPKGNSWIKR